MGRVIMFVVAIVAGVIGTVGILRVNQPASLTTEFREVVVAKADLDAGEVLDEEKLGSRRVPEEHVDPAAVLWAEREGRLWGQRLIVRIPKGGMILSSSLESVLVKDFERRIPLGKRALSVSVSTSTGVSGLLQPGSHVDIMAMYTEVIGPGNIAPTSKIKVLLQNVTILAVGKLTSVLASGPALSRMGQGSYSTVTVAVTLEEAEVLIAAQQRGTLYCVLRSPEEDAQPVVIPERSVSEALGAESINQINRKRYEVQGSVPLTRED